MPHQTSTRALTKQDLETHPFAAAFENSNSPDSVMVHGRVSKASPGLRQVQSFYDISALRHLLSYPFSPAKTIFTGIGVLLGVGLFPHTLSYVPAHMKFNSGGEGRCREL